MDRHVPGALVAGFESLIPDIELPDPDDRHVVAAAVQTRAEAIVTFNRRDFPDRNLTPLGTSGTSGRPHFRSDGAACRCRTEAPFGISRLSITAIAVTQSFRR